MNNAVLKSVPSFRQRLASVRSGMSGIFFMICENLTTISTNDADDENSNQPWTFLQPFHPAKNFTNSLFENREKYAPFLVSYRYYVMAAIVQCSRFLVNGHRDLPGCVLASLCTVPRFQNYEITPEEQICITFAQVARIMTKAACHSCDVSLIHSDQLNLKTAPRQSVFSRIFTILLHRRPQLNQ